MTSKIEQMIDEIEEYIDSCKFAPLSKDKIIVNFDELKELISELKTRTPEEIKKYQKIIANQEAILADARKKAEEIINEAQIHTNELVSEHQIMQQAYSEANRVVTLATNQAQEILDNATTDANNIRTAAIDYTRDMLNSVESILKNTIDTSRQRQDAFINNLNGCLDIVLSNKNELLPPEEKEIIPTLERIEKEIDLPLSGTSEKNGQNNEN
ncbi:MAG: hypothetical protein IJM91_06390 [Lachnospiraceae bacterium]|nr:hypothetical protein [Lachnospiraceae bacterium]